MWWWVCMQLMSMSIIVSVGRDVTSFGGARTSCAVSLQHEMGKNFTGELYCLHHWWQKFLDCVSWSVVDGRVALKMGALTLKNRLSCYLHTLKEHARSEFEGEVDRWIKEDVLIPWMEEMMSRVLQLMATVQPIKGKNQAATGWPWSYFPCFLFQWGSLTFSFQFISSPLVPHS